MEVRDAHIRLLEIQCGAVSTAPASESPMRTEDPL